MALMTNDIQEKLVKLLTEEGLVSTDVIQGATLGAVGRVTKHFVRFLLSEMQLMTNC